MNKQTLIDTIIQAKQSPPRLAIELLDTAITQLVAAQEIDKRDNAKYDALMKTGKCAADALREMVAALECDYDRLEELKEERGDYEPDTDGDSLSAEDKRNEWATVFHDDATELTELETAAGECTSQDEARERIQEDALSVEVRADWHEVGGDSEPTDFTILLTTGGPAVRIMGELQDGQPHRAWLEVQDWGTSWTEYRDDGLSDVLLAYAGCFYFGEG